MLSKLLSAAVLIMPAPAFSAETVYTYLYSNPATVSPVIQEKNDYASYSHVDDVGRIWVYSDRYGAEALIDFFEQPERPWSAIAVATFQIVAPANATHVSFRLNGLTQILGEVGSGSVGLAYVSGPFSYFANWGYLQGVPSDFLTFPVNGGRYTMQLSAEARLVNGRRANSYVFVNPERIVYTLVPEPRLWGMMILGFALVGVRLRRKRTGATTGHPALPIAPAHISPASGLDGSA